MIPRKLRNALLEAVDQSPLTIVGGMLGSGKTTLVNETLDWPYISLKDFCARSEATRDPVSFLHTHFRERLVLDDCHLAPNLLSAVGSLFDRSTTPGQLLLVTSRRLSPDKLPPTRKELTLHPPSLAELDSVGMAPKELEEAIWNCGYAALYPKADPAEAHRAFWQRFLDHEAPRHLRLTLPETFSHFTKLCAGAIGELVNYSRLGDNCGVSHNSCRAWLEALTNYYLVDLLHPHPNGFGRRAVRTPKLYFTDTGLATCLLGLRSPDDLIAHYQRGGLFENFVLSELRKNQQASTIERFEFWRDKQGSEVDLLALRQGASPTAIELKAGRGISASYFDSLNLWSSLTGSKPEQGIIFYGGDENHTHPMGQLLSWRSASHLSNLALETT